MTENITLNSCDDVSLKSKLGLRWRMKKTLLMAFGMQLLLALCCHLPAQAQASDGLWKTYMETAAKALESKNYDEAEKFYKLAEVKAKAFGETDERYVKTLAQLVKLYLTQKKKAEVDLNYKLLLTSLEKGAGAESLNNSNEVLQLATAFGTEKMLVEAEPLLKYALAIYRRGMKPGDTKVLDNIYLLGNNYFMQNKQKEAEETLKEALTFAESDLDSGRKMALAYALGALGFITTNSKRYTEAENYTRRALNIVRNLHGENHPHTATLMHALFLVLLPQEKYAEAESLMKRAIDINEHVYGKTSAQVAFVMDTLAMQYISQGRDDEAATLMTGSLDILDNLPASQPDQVKRTADRLFGIYLKKRNYTDGTAVCKRARSIFEKTSQRNAERDLFVTNCLMVMYFNSGNYVAEAETLKEFIESQERLGANGEIVLASKLVALGNSYIRQKKYDDAIAAFRRAEKIYSKNPAKPDISLLYSLARYHYFTGTYAESETYFTKVFALSEQDKDALDALALAWYKKGYALLLYAQGKTTQAETIFKTSVETLRTDKTDGERDAATSWHELATLFTAQGKHTEAEPLFKQAIELREKALGANHPEVAASLEGYAGLLKKAGRAGEAAPLESRAQEIRAKQSLR